MPKWLHDKLKKKAKEKNLSGKRAQAYIYSVLNKHGVKQRSRRKATTVAKPNN